jgi:isopentenyl phosphate kinase
MEFIKELLALSEAKTPTTIKRASASAAASKVLKNVVIAKGGSGGHYNAKKDYVRAKEKQKIRNSVDESTE